ncbi:peptidylprolyl isomerase [Rubripirellula amarantea]|nr:peptidylprolyl isomerase [Rubripirellula amarantea]
MFVAAVVAGADEPSENPLVQVELDTSLGKIRVQLDSDRAPQTVKNFMAYVESGFYEGTVFHRVIKDFVIQGGGRGTDLRLKDTQAAIANESDNGLKNDEYSIAMARKTDPDSATSQFFINTAGDNHSLDRDQCPDGVGYTVFGEVIAGKEVVDLIESVATRSVVDPHFPAIALGNVPIEPIVIHRVTVVEPSPEAIDSSDVLNDPSPATKEPSTATNQPSPATSEPSTATNEPSQTTEEP